MSLVEQVWGIDPSQIREQHAAALQSFNEGSEPPPCLPVTIGSSWQQPVEPIGSLDDLVSSSDAVVVGTVIAEEGGFFGGKLPGVVLTIQATSWIGARPGFEKSQTILVAYPGGEVSVGMVKLCAATNGYPPAPVVGDKVMLFPDATMAIPGVPYIDFFSDRTGAGLYWSAGVGVARTSEKMTRAFPRVLRDATFASLERDVSAAVARSALR